MTTDYRSTLASIRRFDQLIAFLRDDMDWPIVSDDFEELTFEYSAEELGIDAANAAKIQEIKRLRPLAVNQPWGVFFVKFEPKRLPVVALRSILGRVALKKRASANNAERPAWAMEDLLFISNYGEGDARQISFAHFAAPASSAKMPTLKVVAWDDQDTGLHLDQVARDLTEHLAWPVDEDDADAWREQWRAAFTLGYREAITTAQELAVRLAELAKVTRDRIHGALEIESERGRITRLMKAFSKTLVHDLDAEGFADMVAQTIAYGLLSARITDPQRASVDGLAHHMRTNPLLRDLMSAFLELSDRQLSIGIDFDELGVSEVVELLDHANMDAVVRDFGDRNPREDPVIHFYESFLSEYDKQKKVERGVFYTPRPVVSYIVRSVDQLLRTEFGLDDGLADVTTWHEMTKRYKNLSVPEGISRDQDFVQILDPATGTGTFLVEAIELIYRTLEDKWKAQGRGKRDIERLWNEYVPAHLLPRLHGYELLMAPYAIAHLKIGLKLYETGYRFGSEERAQVYLTNALEPAQDFSSLMDFAIPALAEEAQAVNQVKAGQRFTVVIGNPPYSGHSANKGDWIRGLLRGEDGSDATGSYFHIDGKPLGERNPKWLNDDYVKFIRYAHRSIERTRVGILGFVTNHSYMDNPTFRGMRQSLKDTFAEVHLLDLHGNSKKKERTPEGGKDENVFDIQQGVAVCLYVKSAAGPDAPTQLSHSDLWGERDAGPDGGKYGWLADNIVTSTPWAELSPTSPLYLFVPRDETLAREYEDWWGINGIFPVSSVGIITARDKLTIQWSSNEMKRVAANFAELPEDKARKDYDLPKDVRDWRVQWAQEDVRSHPNADKQIKPILYRPFDRRYTYYTGQTRGFICMPRPEVMRHMLAGPNLGLISVRQVAEGIFNHALVAKTISDFRTTLSNKGGSYIFPLYTYPTEGQEHLGMEREPNLGEEFVEALGSSLELEFISDASGNLQESFGPNDVFNYIYAVLHSPEYRQRYADFLKSDFPRIPLASDPSVFAALVALGKSLAALHLMESEGDEVPAFPVAGDNRVDRVRYAPPNRVFVNRAQYFESVSPETWEFTIGGYRPAEKWLKDRKGHVLSDYDIDHYRQIIAALAGTGHLMKEIDELIEGHGGWPEAFQ